MGLYDGYFGSGPWGGGGMMGQSPVNPWAPSYAPLPQSSPWGPLGYEQSGVAIVSPANPFSSMRPAMQGPMNGAAPMSDPSNQPGGNMVSQPSLLGTGGLDARGMNSGLIPQQGPMGGQTGGNMTPQQPSNPFASFGRFGW